MPWHAPRFDFEAVETPYAGSSPATFAASAAGAKHGQMKAGTQAWRVFLLLRDQPRTMRELSELSELPINIICARMGFLRKHGLVIEAGSMPGPCGALNTLWRAKL